MNRVRPIQGARAGKANPTHPEGEGVRNDNFLLHHEPPLSHGPGECHALSRIADTDDA